MVNRESVGTGCRRFGGRVVRGAARVGRAFDRQDLMFLGGLAASAYGAWLIYAPAGWVWSGVVLLLVALGWGERRVAPPSEPKE